MSKKIEVEEGSGNIFADIGLPNPEERLAKADLAIRIAETIRARPLTQTRAARILKNNEFRATSQHIGLTCGALSRCLPKTDLFFN
jgi:hypothetical protein